METPSIADHCPVSAVCHRCVMCQCFSPTTFQLTETTHARVQAEENDGPTTMGENRGPLAMLMEEMEQEPPSSPAGTTTDISADVIDSGDWLAFIYDQNWWLAKAVTVNAHHQDIQVEFFPHGPNTSFHLSKLGEKDMCFVPVEDITVKLMEPSAPSRASKTREIYHLVYFLFCLTLLMYCCFYFTVHHCC